MRDDVEERYIFPQTLTEQKRLIGIPLDEANRNHAGTVSAVQYCQLWLAGTGDAAGSRIRLAGAGAVPGAVIFTVAVLCCMAERCKWGSPRAGRYGHDTAGIVSCA